MGLLDPTLILDYIVAFAVIAAPFEAWIGLQIYKFRVSTTRVLEDPAERGQLIHEVAAQIWQPISTPEAREKLLAELWQPLTSPEARQKLISEIGHGLLRAFTERAGSNKGALIRSASAEQRAAAIASGDGVGLLKSLPGKIELPMIGKVSPGEALELLSSLRGILGGLKGSEGAGFGRVIEGSSTASGGYPP